MSEMNFLNLTQFLKTLNEETTLTKNQIKSTPNKIFVNTPTYLNDFLNEKNNDLNAPTEASSIRNSIDSIQY